MLDIMFSDGITLMSLLPFIMVFIGAVLQMTTGVGLGLIAGPFLLFLLEAPQAIQTAILLNLLLTACVLPTELKMVEIASLKRLSLWACLGIPLGAFLLVSVDSTSSKLFAGVVVLGAALQMKFIAFPKQNPKTANRLIGIGGGVSGVMTGALAIPGPVALWALLSTGMAPKTTRATLRVYFIVAYSFAFLIHYFLTGVTNNTLVVSMLLSPPVLCGIGVGFLLQGRISVQILGRILEMILFLMGTSLIIKSLLEP